MKTIALFAGLIYALCMLQATTDAAPADLVSSLPEDNQLLVEEPALGLTRQKRATCDLLSGFGLQHSACAAHCVLRGNRGGYCNGRAVCVCRN